MESKKKLEKAYSLVGTMMEMTFREFVESNKNGTIVPNPRNRGFGKRDRGRIKYMKEHFHPVGVEMITIAEGGGKGMPMMIVGGHHRCTAILELFDEGKLTPYLDLPIWIRMVPHNLFQVAYSTMGFTTGHTITNKLTNTDLPLGKLLTDLLEEAGVVYGKDLMSGGLSTLADGVMVALDLEDGTSVSADDLRKARATKTQTFAGAHELPVLKRFSKAQREIFVKALRFCKAFFETAIVTQKAMTEDGKGNRDTVILKNLARAPGMVQFFVLDALNKGRFVNGNAIKAGNAFARQGGDAFANALVCSQGLGRYNRKKTDIESLAKSLGISGKTAKDLSRTYAPGEARIKKLGVFGQTDRLSDAQGGE